MMPKNRRWIAVAALLAAGVGCNSNAYDPKATNAELTAFAAKTKYPTDLQAQPSDNVLYSIGDNGVITLNNLGDRTLADFQLWVNKSYVLQVTSLPAHNVKTFAPELFYNAAGQTLKDEPVSQSWTVQLKDEGKLLTAKGPVKM